MDKYRRIIAVPLLGLALGLSSLVYPPTARAEGNSATHKVSLNVEPYRILYVKDNKISEIQNLSNRGYFPENKIIVRNEGNVGVPMSPDIQQQYYALLNPEVAQRAGINWGECFDKVIDSSILDSPAGTLTDFFNYSTPGLKVTTEKLEGLVVTTIIGD